MARGDVLPRRNLPQSAEPWGRKIGERVQDIEGALNRAEAAIVANNRAQNGLGVVLAGTSNLAEDLKANSELVAETMNQVNIDLTKNAEILEAANLELDANKEALIQLDKDLVKEAQERVDAILAVQGAIADLSGEIEGIDGGPTVSPNTPTAANGEGKKNGALWYRVDGQKNVVGTWSWNGTAWDPVTFGPGSISAGIMDDISTAKTNAQSALTGAGNANLAAQTADGKVTWSLSAPVAANGKLADGRNRAEGSTWYHRDAANNVIGLYRWNGTTAWVSQPLNAGAIANNAITSDKLATAVKTSITTAQQTADGKNTVHYLGTAPAGTGHKVGDTWFNTAQGNRIARWSGSAWVVQELGGAAIADLAITNAKIAEATIQSAKIGSVDAETITVNKLKGVQIEANTIKGENIAAGTIGTGKLMIGDMEDLFEDRSLAAAGAWTGNFSLIPRSSPNQSANMMVIRGGTTAVDVHSTKIVDVLGGEKIAVEGQVFSGSGASGTAWIFARVTLANGTSQWPNVAKSITSAQGTDVISGIITVPANAVKLQMAVSLRADFTPGAITNWHSLSAKFQKPSTLIENGAITTDKMVANSIEGDRIKAGTLNADKIVSGSIEAAQIKAGSIFSDRLAVGNFDNLIEDPLFQLPLTADGPWKVPTGSLAAWSYMSNAADPVRVIRGTATPGAGQRLANRNKVSVTTGERFVLSTRAASSITGTNAQVGVVWRTLGGGFHSSNYYSIPGGGGFQNHSFTTNPAPADAVYAEFELQIPAAATGGSVQFGNLLWQTSIGRTVIQGGAIGTDQIESKAIITDKLAAFAVTADQLSSNAVTADKIKANEISSEKIATAGLDAGVIKFGEMSGARIEANTISASKLVIGDFTNLVDDPYFTLSLGATDSEWVQRSGSTAASTLSTTDGLPGRTMTLHGVSSEVSVWTKGTFQVQPGQNYRVDFRTQNQLTGSAPISYVRVYWFQKDMAAATGGFSGIGIPAGTSWTDALGATVTAPANAALARVMLIHGSNNTGGTWWIGNIAVRRTTGATLIDDKSISTNSIVTEGLNANTIKFGTMHGDRIESNTIATKHIVTTGLTADAIAANAINAGHIIATGLTADAIAANAVTADKINSNAVTANKIKGDAIDGMTITGSTLRTAASGTRVQINGTGTQNGISVYTGTGSNSEQVRIGYGIANGLEIRNPVTNALTELAPVIFGSTSSTIGQSMANWKALNWPWTSPVMSTGPLDTKYQVDMPGSTFTALTNRILVTFSAEANFYIGSMNAAAVYLSVLRVSDNYEAQIPIAFFVQRLGNEPQSKMHFLSKTATTTVARGTSYRLQGCAITRRNQAGDSPGFNYAQPNGVDIGQLTATIQSI